MIPYRTLYFLLFFSLFLFFVSCHWFRHENPCHDTIEKDKMVELLTEVHLLESHLSLRQSRVDMADSAALFYAGLFQKYEVSAEEFDQAFECYMLDRELMTEVFDEVLSNLSIAQSKADEKKEEEEREEEKEEEKEQEYGLEEKLQVKE